MSRFSISGAKSARYFAAVGLVLLFSSPLVLLWASRSQVSVTGDDAVMLELSRMEARQIAGLQLPSGTVRPAGHAVFGEAFEYPRIDEKGVGRGRLVTNLGSLDVRNPGGLLDRVPAGLKLHANEKTSFDRGSIRPGLMYVRIAPSEMGRGAEVQDAVARVARLVGFLPEGWMQVYVEARNVGALQRLEGLSDFVVAEPWSKIGRHTGHRILTEEVRALDPNLLLEIYTMPGADMGKVRQRLEAIRGVGSIAEFGPAGLQVKAHHSVVADIARIDEILWVDETAEYGLLNAKNSPTLQAGSVEDGLQIRPYDDAGIDGGGIDTNADGQRINNGSDAVPPQIVGIIDNGVSMDIPSFSQTATQVTDLAHPIGATHRKVHYYNASRGDNLTCDAILSGSGTHGTVTASVIGAYPSQLGFYATRTKNGLGGAGVPRNANLDGVARGVRIIVTDAQGSANCNINSLIERGGSLDPGRLVERLNEYICPRTGGTGSCSGIIGGASEVHLAVTPFGHPDNFSTSQFPPSNGTYPVSAVDLDRFLYNNRDFMIVAPVGNSGGTLGSNRVELALDVVPDLYNGTPCDDGPPAAPCAPTTPRAVQIAPPATAKNIIAVGASRSDCLTFFGAFDCENRTVDFSSHGPASPESLRTAPILTAPSSDIIPTFETASIAVFRSSDNDQNNPVGVPMVAQIDEANFGTSFSAANITGAAAIVRDYFAQGFYPTGSRTAGNRVANISGALVKAALVASAKFNITISIQNHTEVIEQRLERSRGYNLGVQGAANEFIGVFGNNTQGYGHVVLPHVLPIANWSKSFTVSPNNSPEFPAQSLIVYDSIATGEPMLGNDAGAAACSPGATSCSHTFRVAGSKTGTGANGGLAVYRGELRVALAWPDVPSPAGSGGPLVNDLDLTVESPGPNGCLGAGDTKVDGTACAAGTETDNLFYDGNVYRDTNSTITGQWGQSRTALQPELHDFRNPQEAIHLNSDPSNNFTNANDNLRFNDSPLYVGTWRVTVKRGCGGSVPCTCTGDPATTGNLCGNGRPTCDAIGSPEIGTCANGSLSGLGAANEDANGNYRLDPPVALSADAPVCGVGEDTNGNCLLDLGGQAYGLVVAGSVIRMGPAPAAGPQSFPASSITLDKIRYSCTDTTAALLFDSTGGGATAASSGTTFTVVNSAGAVLDTEVGIAFSPAASAGAFSSAPVPVRLGGASRTSYNGILEADTNNQVVATYSPAGQAAVSASAQVKCSPDFIPGFFAFVDNISFGDQVTVGNGCDQDENFDAGETVTYGIGINNRSRTDDYSDVVATLVPSGPGAAALRVLDSPQNIGRVPGNAFQGIFFHVYVDPATANALSVANRTVTLTLNLDSNAEGQRISRQTYAFAHAINSDRETFHYSTDFPAGSRQVRDINRNLLIDAPDVLDPFLAIMYPDEDVTFSSMFVAGDAAGRVTNTLGEDLDADGVRDANEPDLIPDNVLNRGILFQAAGPSSADRVPFGFDNGDGGWVPVRHPGSTSGSVPGFPTSPVWEYKTSGLCGFQSALNGATGQPDVFGIWHTGDGDTTSPSPTATACDNHPSPQNAQTEARVDLFMDVLLSPIIAKVHQTNDGRGFPFEVEFQRAGWNVNMQVQNAAYSSGGINIDNDVDTDNENCMLCQQLDTYYTRRAGGWPYGVFRFTGGQYFETGSGIDPLSAAPVQRTFGPFQDPDNSIRICTGGTKAGSHCVSPANCPGGTCSPDSLTIDGIQDLNGDESGFSGFTQNSNIDSLNPIPTAPPDFLPYPLPGAPVPGVCSGGNAPGSPCQSNSNCGTGGTCTLAQNTIAGPARNFDTTLVNYEGQSAHEVLSGTSANEEFFFFTPGPAGNRWQLGLGFFAIESSVGLTDYGFGLDDVVFEWDESHPADEAALGNSPACARFGGVGQPAGSQCATITIDRSQIYECEESIQVTVVDPTATSTSIQVQIVTDSDSVPFSTQRFSVFTPNQKVYTLNRTATNPPTYRGNVVFSSATNTTNVCSVARTPCTSSADCPAGQSCLDGNVFTNPGTDGQFIVYYLDPDCDADADGAVAENQFDNYDGDGVADAADNCPFTYDPLQGDADSDGLGDLCDNCPTVANADQGDKNADDVGDACEYDDVDGDSIGEAEGDNCPGLYQDTLRDADLDGRGDACDTAVCRNQPTTSCTADADCPLRCSNGATRACTVDTDCATGGVCGPARGDCRGLITAPDTDADGVADTADNCILVPNANQRNADVDGLGDRCDGDCTVLSTAYFCSNVRPLTTCTPGVTDCGYYCLDNPDAACPGGNPAACPNGGLCLPNSCQPSVNSHPSGNCSTVDDDLDVDGVEDTLDNCATVSNPSIIPATKRQADLDRDGLGDQCDPAGTFDDDFDGVPDDLLTFQGGIACRTLPLGTFAILSADYRDMDGDHDIFPDTGETGVVRLTIQNSSRNPGGTAIGLTGASFTLTSTDSDVDCITQPTIVHGSVAPGQTVILSVLPDATGAGGSGFTFRASNTLQTVSPASPAKTEFCLTAQANETLGTTAPVCFTLLADLELPIGVSQDFTFGPDGIAATADDGTIVENFDVDRDGDGNITVNDTFLWQGAGGPHGSYIYGSETGVGANVVAGIPCGGFAELQAGNSACALDPDYPMDWHVHCAPGAANCPNLESGSGNSIGTGACVGGCFYTTPANGARAFNGANSMHMGAHFDSGDETKGDTTHFRMVAAFVSAPINLALFPRVGDLQLSMYHIADIMDNNGVGPGNRGQCVDCGDVQVRVDLETNPAADSWGTWDKLVPFQNVYDHKPNAWSVFGNYYCEFTPGDTGTAAPAPRGVHETLCFPLGAWSHCGSVRGTTVATVADCLSATGLFGSSGNGVWVETKFNLAGFLGQRIQVRWIGSSWVFDFASSAYFDTAGWDATQADDGWWLDNIKFSGTITTQLTPPPDFDSAPGTSCPVGCNSGTGDNGTAASIRFATLADVTIDGTTVVATAGQTIRVSAAASIITGGCVDGVAQYEFTKNGVVVQEFNGKAFYQDAPDADATYKVRVRCSTSFNCTSATGATASIQVYSGTADHTELRLDAAHTAGVTTLSWKARVQAAPMSGYNVFRGSRLDDGLPTTPSTPDTTLSTLVALPPDPLVLPPDPSGCIVLNGAAGTTLSRTDSQSLPLHSLYYYLLGHRHTAGAPTVLGRRSDGSVRYAPIACP